MGIIEEDEEPDEKEQDPSRPPTLPRLVEKIGLGPAQLKVVCIAGAVWFADGAELLLISAVTDSISEKWGLSFKVLIEKMNDAVEAQPHGDLYLVAHDWGAYLGLLYADKHPTEVSKLALLDIGHQKMTDKQSLAEYVVGPTYQLFLAWCFVMDAIGLRPVAWLANALFPWQTIGPCNHEPQLPAGAKASVYKIAERAGWKPAEFCAVRNDAATCGAAPSAPDLIDADALLPTSSRGLFMGGAAAAEVDDAGLANDRQKQPTRLKTALDEAASYLEDPHVTERWVFSQQQKMGPLR